MKPGVKLYLSQLWGDSQNFCEIKPLRRQSDYTFAVVTLFPSYTQPLCEFELSQLFNDADNIEYNYLKHTKHSTQSFIALLFFFVMPKVDAQGI